MKSKVARDKADKAYDRLLKLEEQLSAARQKVIELESKVRVQKEKHWELGNKADELERDPLDNYGYVGSRWHY